MPLLMTRCKIYTWKLHMPKNAPNFEHLHLHLKIFSGVRSPTPKQDQPHPTFSELQHQEQLYPATQTVPVPKVEQLREKLTELQHQEQLYPATQTVPVPKVEQLREKLTATKQNLKLRLNRIICPAPFWNLRALDIAHFIVFHNSSGGSSYGRTGQPPH